MLRSVGPLTPGGVSRDVIWDQPEDLEGNERLRMLAVVRFGDGQESANLDHVRTIASEHGARLSVIGVWRPRWWLWIVSSGTCAPVAGFALSSACEQAERLWRSPAAGVELESLRIIGHLPLAPLVEQQLAGGGYGYVVGRCVDLPRRRVRRWRRGDPSLDVIRY